MIIHQRKFQIAIESKSIIKKSRNENDQMKQDLEKNQRYVFISSKLLIHIIKVFLNIIFQTLNQQKN